MADIFNQFAPAKATAPTAQGSQGASAQPNVTSTNQGPQGAQGAPASTPPPSTPPPSPPSGGQNQFSQPPSQQAPNSGAALTGGIPPSPVASNGSIPPQGSTPPLQVAQATTPPPPTGLAASGGAAAPPALPPGWVDVGYGNLVRNTANGQMVDRNHPIFLQAVQAAGAAPAAGGGGAAPAANPWGPWPATPAGATYTPPASLGTDPFAQYTPGQVSQFQAPDQSQQVAQQMALLGNVLGSPESLSPQVIAMLQQRNQETALAQQDAQQQAALQDAAARGVSHGGAAEAQQRNFQEQANQNILSGNRDISIQAAQTNMADRLRALSSANDVLNSQATRASGLYQTGLQGQLAQEGLAQQGASSQQQAQQLALQRTLGLEGLNQAGAQSQSGNYFNNLDAYLRNQALQSQTQLGQGGLALDQSRLSESGRQFDLGNQLNWAQLMNQMALGGAQVGLSTAQLQQNAQNALFSSIFGAH